MKPEVEAAIAELRASGIGEVQAIPDADGGAHIKIGGLDIGERFVVSETWIGFHITWTYPDADVYPHFLPADVRYVGVAPTPNVFPEGNLPVPLTRGATLAGFDDPAIQVSRRSSRRNAATDSALQKLLRVLNFLRGL